MKIKVYVVDLEIPPRLKRWGLRIGIPTALIAGAGAIAYASVPKTWATGDTLTAPDLNNNFGNLDGRVGKLETKLIVTKGGKQYSLGATYCGETPISVSGQITGGHAGAKSVCESLAACGSSPSAHMCTADEVIRSMAVGIAQPTTGGWYSNGVRWYEAYHMWNGNDCQNWTSGASNWIGPVWGSDYTNGLDISLCSNPRPILCCD